MTWRASPDGAAEVAMSLRISSFQDFGFNAASARWRAIDNNPS